MNIEEFEDPEALRRRIMDLEGALIYVKNFLPDPLKKHAEEVLFGQPQRIETNEAP